MKIKYWVFLLCFCFVIALAAPLRAADEASPVMPTADLTIDVLSMYYSKGQECSRNSVVFQPSVTIGYYGFSINMWGNLDTRPYSTPSTQTNRAAWNETDFVLSYGKTIGMVNLSGSYAYYGYSPYYAGQTRWDDQQEIYGSVGLNTLMAPTFTVYKMIDGGLRWYFKMGVSHAFEFNKYVGLKLEGTVGYLLGQDKVSPYEAKFYNDATPIPNETYNGLLDGVVTVSIPLKPPIKNVTITPKISYAFPLTSDAKNYMKGVGWAENTPADRQSNYLFGGISFNYSF